MEGGYQTMPIGLGPARGFAASLFKVVAVLHEGGAQGAHRAILRFAVSAGDVDHRLHARASCSESDGLPVVAAGGCYRAARRAAGFAQMMEIGQGTAGFERAQR